MSLFIKRVKKKVQKQNNNYQLIIVGPTGSGKSWSALTLASAVDPDFTTDHVAFSPQEFIDITKDTNPGQAIVFDEAGVGIGNRDWYKKVNKKMMKIMQTIRHENQFILFTTPDTSFVDKQARSLFDSYMEMVSLNPQKKEAIAKIQRMQMNPKTGKIYYKNLRFDNLNTGFREKISKYKMKPPTQDLTKPYEKRADKFKRRLKDEGVKNVMDIGKKVDSKKSKIKKLDKKDVSRKEIAEKLDTSGDYVRAVLTDNA